MPRVDRDGPWHRCVDAGHAQPWYFSTRTGNADPGRFDLVGPRGTCYLAGSEAAALIEVCAEPDADDPPPPSSRWIAALRIWSGHLHDGTRLADATVPSTPRLTTELATVVPYDLPQRWADALDADGARGLIYTARFGHGDALALFGPGGVPAPEDPEDPRNAGDLAPAPASDCVDRLPPAMRPVSVNETPDFEAGPPPTAP